MKSNKIIFAVFSIIFFLNGSLLYSTEIDKDSNSTEIDKDSKEWCEVQGEKLTDLMKAALYGDLSIFKPVELGGMSEYEIQKTINFKDKDGRTALMWALDYHRIKFARELLKYSADVTAVGTDDWAGWTALIYAIFINPENKSIVKEILDVSTENINSQVSLTGDTPLIIAVDLGYEDTALLLLEKKADPFIKNKKGEYAYSIARKKKLNKVTSYVRKLFPDDSWPSID
jgi:ankyrin repeat protein